MIYFTLSKGKKISFDLALTSFAVRSLNRNSEVTKLGSCHKNKMLSYV